MSDHERERRRALADLERAGAESEVFAGSALARSAERAKRHLLADDAPADDPVERWGRRLGRGLSILLFALLLVYLAATYL